MWNKKKKNKINKKINIICSLDHNNHNNILNNNVK